MNASDYQLIDALFNTKNISKAAELMFVSQPALTYQLQRIEKELEIKIVNRGNKGVEFTAEGERLVDFSKEMLLRINNFKDSLFNMSEKIQGNLRLGVSSNYAHYKLPSLLNKFLQIYPNIKMSIYTGWSTEMLPLLQNNQVHVAILRGDMKWSGKKILIEEENVCLVSKKEIDLKELPYMGRINFKTDPLLQKQIDDWWQINFKTPPLSTIKVDRIDTCKEMVINNLGYAIMPQISLRPQDNLYTFNLEINNERIVRKTELYYNESSLELSIVKAFIEFMDSESRFL